MAGMYNYARAASFGAQPEQKAMFSFGAMPDMPQVQEPEPMPEPQRDKSFMDAQAAYMKARESGVYDENGMREDGRMYRKGPKTRIFIAKHGKEIIKKDANLMKQLNAITIAENRELGGFAPLEEQSEQVAPAEQEKPLKFDEATKLAALQTSYGQIQDLAEGLFDENGNLKRADLAKSRIPGTKEAGYRTKTDQAVETWLRAMTGAAVTKDEVDRYQSMYIPQPWDAPDVALDKLDRLASMYSATLKNMGRPLQDGESLVAKIKRRRADKQKTKASEQSGNQDDEWSDI